jgi:hypothetical protein
MKVRAAHSESAANLNTSCRCKPCFSKFSPVTEGTHRKGSEELPHQGHQLLWWWWQWRWGARGWMVVMGSSSSADASAERHSSTWSPWSLIKAWCPWCATHTLVARKLSFGCNNLLTQPGRECNTCYPHNLQGLQWSPRVIVIAPSHQAWLWWDSLDLGFWSPSVLEPCCRLKSMISAWEWEPTNLRESVVWNEKQRGALELDNKMKRFNPLISTSCAASCVGCGQTTRHKAKKQLPQ